MYFPPLVSLMQGQGLVSASGGSGGIHGGGGGGGRISIHFSNNTFHGSLQAMGGTSGYEVGGAGTVLLDNRASGERTLLINNGFRTPGPLARGTDYDITGSEESCRTWLLPAFDGDQYVFEELSLKGRAHLAIGGVDHPSMNTTVTVRRSSGDSSGFFHVGPHQVGTCILSSKIHFEIGLCL